MYHRVLSQEMRAKTFSHDGIIVDLKTFEKQIRYLKDNFNVITLEEFTLRLQNGNSFDKYTCLITFDDGWKDNYVFAYPVLQKYELPATIFLPVNYINKNKQFWQEELTRVLINIYHKVKEHKYLQSKYHKLLKNYDLQDIICLPESKLRASIAEKVSGKKQITFRQIEQMVAELSENTGFLKKVREDYDTFLSWDDISQMKSGGITFGSHGMSHKIMTKVSLSEAEYEIMESKRDIENRLNREISSISYPNGDYKREIIELVRTHGYQTAFGTEKGFFGMSDSPYSIKRINIHNDVTSNIPMFLSTILGVF